MRYGLSQEAQRPVFLKAWGGLVAAEVVGRRDSPARRAAILDIALAVLAERGYTRASMREIATRAHASKETLYAWFGDKRGLFEALIEWQAARLDAALGENL